MGNKLMLQQFKDFIRKENLFSREDRILLAVSGGMDSVAMAELFHRSGQSFAIAHCNFNLRGEESDLDEHFTEKLARRYKRPFYSRRFETASYAREHGISIQMAARELRYAWFSEVCSLEGYRYVATAHHLDDQMETFFINLTRSTGIGGLHGILPRQGILVRPMLFTGRKEIEAFIRENHLAYREDSSNTETKYLRNKIRHELIPVLREIQPEFPRLLSENIERIRDAETIYRKADEEAKPVLLKAESDRFLIPIPELKKRKPEATFLFEILSPFGFNYRTVKNIAAALDDPPGIAFFSPTHRLIKDRKNLILTGIKTPEPLPSYMIPVKASRLDQPVSLTLKRTRDIKKLRILPDKDRAYLDMAKLSFPLVLRKWKPGDLFYPFGKDRRKKVSDFFIDEKVPVPDKEKCWILCSGNKIAWVVGHRIDNRFRITTRTREALVLKLG